MSRPLAVVTGASRGIGAAAAARLHAAGWDVVRLARSLADHDADGIHDRRCDVTDAAAVGRVAAALGPLGVPDVLVNNAGHFLMRPFEEISPAEFAAEVALNLTAAFTVAHAFLPAMKQAGRGTLVTIGSVADHVGFPGNAAYGASKFGLRGMHESLAAECRGTGVRCTLVSPGPTDTAIWDDVRPGARGGLPSREEMMSPEDVAEAVVFAATRPAGVRVEWIRMEPMR
ncbi:MAG TPA: SDR family oxidoreductase [Gemmatimonadales bacterium]|nr:SDR family oxidoreductase [Gemmatimonadales bacterium]